MDPLSLLIFVVLFALSAFFSGSEIAFMSIPSHTIDTLIKKRSFGARTLKLLKSNVDRLLITILLGNNLVNVFTSAFATKMALDFASKSGFQESIAIGVATGVITMMLLIFGEIMPKSIANRYAVPIALSVSKFYYWLQITLSPVVIIIELIMKIFQGEKKENLTTVTSEEIESLIEIGKSQGAFDEINSKLIKNMLKFEGITVEETMTPRVKIEAFESIITVDEAIQKALTFSHSRIPVYTDRIDDIEWIISLRELVNLQAKGHGKDKLSDLMLNKAFKIPLTQPIDTVLEAFKHKRKHIAIVMDEYGGVAGVVTLEDLIEAVFGDFLDESDKEIKSVQELANGYLMQADITIDDMLDELGLDFIDLGIDEKEYGGETISYYITSILERFPKTGEIINLQINKEKKSKESDESNNKADIVKIQVTNSSSETIESVMVSLIENETNKEEEKNK